MALLKDFKDFALKGNVVDLAIGVIIGAAFGKIVTSLVEDILMPPLGFITGKIDFTKLSLVLAPGEVGADGKVGEPVLLRYGNFLQITFQFLIVAFVIFLITQAIMRMTRKEEAASVPAPEPGPTKEEQLLTEIRDVLKQQAR